jgi:hypothetical protein
MRWNLGRSQADCGRGLPRPCRSMDLIKKVAIRQVRSTSESLTVLRCQPYFAKPWLSPTVHFLDRMSPVETEPPARSESGRDAMCLTQMDVPVSKGMALELRARSSRV